MEAVGLPGTELCKKNPVYKEATALELQKWTVRI